MEGFSSYNQCSFAFVLFLSRSLVKYIFLTYCNVFSLHLKAPPHMEAVFVNKRDLSPFACKPFPIQVKKPTMGDPYFHMPPLIFGPMP